MHHFKAEESVGTWSGAVVGFAKGVYAWVQVSGGVITWSGMIETVFFAFLGATVGFFTTALWKWVQTKFRK